MSHPDGLPDLFRRSQLWSQEGPRVPPRRRPPHCDLGRAPRNPARRDHWRNRFAPTLRRTRMARLQKDDHIRYVWAERRAFVESRVRAAVITNAYLPALEMAQRIIRALTDLAEISTWGKARFCSCCSRTASTRSSSVEPRRSARGRVRKSSAGRKMGPELLNPSLAFNKVEPALTKQRRDLLTAERT